MIIFQTLLRVIGLVCSISIAAGAQTAPLYVATTGNNTTGDGSTVKPWKTIAFATSRMMSGGTLIIKNGTYSEPLGGMAAQPPAGTTGNYTTIRAETDGGVVLDAQGQHVPLELSNSFIRVEGMKFLNGNSWVAVLSGNHIQILRCAFGNGGTSMHDGIVTVEGDDILLEDSWMWGRGKAGVATSDVYRPTLRRLVIRLDKYDGSLGFLGVTFYGAHDVLVENVITLDFNTSLTTFDWKGGFRSRDIFEPRAHRYFGTIALNLPYDGYRTSGSSYENVVAWGVRGARGGIVEDSYKTGFTIKNATVGAATSDGILTNTTEISNSIISNVAGRNSPGDKNTYHATALPSGATNALTTNPQIKYIVRTESSSSANQGGISRGATVLNRYQNGVLTNVPLWPWPNEARIKADFRTDFGLVGVNPKRGFAADGNGLSGQPITLTSYIWEYLGNQIPAEIYGVATTFSSWQAQQSWGAASNAATADPDADGYNNLMEYALDTPPMISSVSTFPQLIMTGGEAKFQYMIDTAKTDLSWVAQSSSNMTAWSSMPATMMSQSGSRQSWQATQPAGEAKKFFRLRVNVP